MLDVFCVVLKGVAPLYGLMTLGYVVGRYLKIDLNTVGTLLIYVFAPAIVFLGVSQSKIAQLGLPLVAFVICCSISLAIYRFLRGRIPSPSRNILAFMAGSGNTGYFGIPVVLYILGDRVLSVAVLITFGFIFFENTLGFYLTAKGRFTARQSLIKVLRLPTFYAFLLGVIFSSFEVSTPKTILAVLQNMKGGYIVLGMMIIGITLAKVRVFSFDKKIVSVAFAAKFLIWPALCLSLILLDRQYSHWLSPEVHKVFFLMSIVPLPANAVALATVLEAEPEKTSLVVVLSTLAAFVIMPLGYYFVGG